MVGSAERRATGRVAGLLGEHDLAGRACRDGERITEEEIGRGQGGVGSLQLVRADLLTLQPENVTYPKFSFPTQPEALRRL